VNDEELRRKVQHAAELHGVTPAEVVEDVANDEDIEEAKKPKSKWEKRVAWSVSLVVVGVLVGGAIVGLMKLMNDPVVTTDGITLGEARKAIEPTPLAASHLSGQYIEFDHPGIFNRTGNQKNWALALEQFHLTAKSDYRWSMEVTVRPTDFDRLDEDSAYKFRTLNREYTPEKVEGLTAIIMVKADKSERTLFWLKNRKLVTVSMTYSGGTIKLADHMAVIAKSIRWRT
jgi:hypothetical protein